MRSSSFIVALFALTLTTATASAQTPHVEVIAASGLQAPGLPAGTTMEVVTSMTMQPITNGDGKVAFKSALRGGSVVPGTDDQVVWFWDSAVGSTMIARSGAQAESLATGINYWFFDTTGLTDQDEVIFRARLTGTGVGTANDYATWSWTRNGTALIGHEGAATPGDPNSTLANVAASSPPMLYIRANPAGHMTFLADVQTTSGSESAIFGKTATAALAPVLVAGSPGPGSTSGETFLGTGKLPVVSATGSLAFTGVTAGNFWYVFGPDASGNLTALAAENAPAPGTAGGNFTRISSDTTLSITDDDRVTFEASFWKGPVFGSGIWQADSTGAILPQALTEDVAAGYSAEGFTYQSFTGLVTNATGDLAFQAQLETAPDTTREVNFGPDGSGGIVPIAAERGMPAADTGGATFNSLNTALLMNAAGQVAYIGGLVPIPPITSQNDFGVWLYTPGEGSRLLLREGDEVEVAPGDMRTVSTISLPASRLRGSGGSDGRPRGLADDGSLVVYVSFFGDGPTAGTNHGGVLQLRLLNSAAPVVADDSYTLANDRSVSIDAPGVLANDSDPEATALSAAVVTDPLDGVLILNADGGFTYTADADFEGTDTFTYEACDTDNTCTNGTVTLDVFAVTACDEVVCDPTGCAATDLVCDDSDPCTDNSCDPVDGCVFTPNSQSCDMGGMSADAGSMGGDAGTDPTDAGSNGETDLGPTDTPVDTGSEDEGCGCATSNGTPTGAPTAILLGGLILGLRLRRRNTRRA